MAVGKMFELETAIRENSIKYLLQRRDFAINTIPGKM